MVRTYYVASASDLGHLPRRLFFLDSNVLVMAAFSCDHTCVRIVESDLPYAYTSRVRKEVAKVGKREFKGIGIEYFDRLMGRKNFAEIVVSDDQDDQNLAPPELRKPLSMHGLSPDDKNMISLLWAGFIRGEEYHVISADRHLANNKKLQGLFLKYAQRPWERVHYPDAFCQDFYKELKPYTFADKLRTDVRRAGYDLRRGLKT